MKAYRGAEGAPLSFRGVWSMRKIGASLRVPHGDDAPAYGEKACGRFLSPSTGVARAAGRKH